MLLGRLMVELCGCAGLGDKALGDEQQPVKFGVVSWSVAAAMLAVIASWSTADLAANVLGKLSVWCSRAASRRRMLVLVWDVCGNA